MSISGDTVIAILSLVVAVITMGLALWKNWRSRSACDLTSGEIFYLSTT
jgi:hypothetical protein